MTSQEIANELSLLLDGDNGIDPAPIRPWPEIVEACRPHGVFFNINSRHTGRFVPTDQAYRVETMWCTNGGSEAVRYCSFTDLQDTVGLAAIEALDAMTNQPK